MDHENDRLGPDRRGEQPDAPANVEPPPARPSTGSGRPPARALGPQTLRSWLILAASLGLALGIYYGFLGSSWVEHIAAWTADWTSRGLNLLGGSTRVSGTLLVSDSFAVNIAAECTAVGPFLLFLGAVIAYPASLKAKGLGAAIGLVILTLVNVVRIMSLFWIGSAYPEFLDMAHLLVWESAIILLAIVMWLVWAERAVGARKV